MGSGVWPLAMTTRPSKGQESGISSQESGISCRWALTRPDDEARRASSKRGLPLRATGLPCLVGTGPTIAWQRSRVDQADRAISTGWLKALPPFYLRPIDVMVCHGSRARPGFEGGFPLRCFQRLSRPHLATRRCGRRHNRYTRGASIPVLSY